MTRFARAKGSKASNERVAEEATPWSELKQQLLEKNKEIEDNQRRREANEKRSANYKAFLEDKEKEESKNSSWAEFPGSKKPLKEGSPKKIKLSAANKFHKQTNTKTLDQQEINNLNHGIISNSTESDSDDPPEEQSSKKEIVEPIVGKKKKLKVNKPLKITLEADRKNNKGDQEASKTTRKRIAADNVEGNTKRIKKAKNNAGSKKNEKNPEDIKQKKKIVKENLTEKDLKKIEKKKQKRIKQVEKKKRVKEELKAQKETEIKAQENGETKPNDENQGKISGPLKSFEKSNVNTPRKTFNTPNKFKERKKKVQDNEEHPRKKPFLPHKMFINGKELEVDYVDGFPVKKEDAMRLKKLRKEMISKGLPRSEINVALKLERRKAEKAFAREKKKVCTY